MPKRYLLPVLEFHLLIFLIALAVITKPPSQVLSATNHVVISEVQISGTGDVDDDFIELYNPTDSDFDLNGHRLVKRTQSGTTDASIKAWDSATIITAHSYYLWANSNWTPAVTPDASTAASLAINNGVALRQGPEDTGTIIDSVAWGTSTNAFVESTAFSTNPDDDQSIERKPGENDPLTGNGTDTDNNANDLALRLVSEPQNSTSATEIPVDASPTPEPSPDASPSPDSTPVGTPEPTPDPTPEPSVTPSPTPEISPSPSPTPEESPSPTPETSPTPTPEASPSPTPQVSPSPTPVPSPSATPEPTASPTPEPTPEPSPSPTPETTPSPTPEASPSPSPEVSPTASPETSPSPTPETSPSPTPDISPSPTPEATVSPIPEATPSPETSPTATPEATVSPTPTPAPSATPSPEPSPESQVFFRGFLFTCSVRNVNVPAGWFSFPLPRFSCWRN